MKMFIALAAVLAASSAQAASNEDMDKLYQAIHGVEADYGKCVSEQAVRMGAGNKEPSSDIVEAAFAKCEQLSSDFRSQMVALSVMDGNVLGSSRAADNELETLRGKVRPAAMAAVLDARAGK